MDDEINLSEEVLEVFLAIAKGQKLIIQIQEKILDRIVSIDEKLVDLKRMI